MWIRLLVLSFCCCASTPLLFSNFIFKTLWRRSWSTAIPLIATTGLFPRTFQDGVLLPSSWVLSHGVAKEDCQKQTCHNRQLEFLDNTHVRCFGDFSCANLTLRAPAGVSVIVECTGRHACLDAGIPREEVGFAKFMDIIFYCHDGEGQCRFVRLPKYLVFFYRTSHLKFYGSKYNSDWALLGVFLFQSILWERPNSFLSKLLFRRLSN